VKTKRKDICLVDGLEMISRRNISRKIEKLEKWSARWRLPEIALNIRKPIRKSLKKARNCTRILNLAKSNLVKEEFYPLCPKGLW
jgi:DNA primase large subunit